MSIADDVKITLKRPYYARGKKAYDIALNDETDRYWKPEGITKDFLNKLTVCRADGAKAPLRAEGYFSDTDHYILYLDIKAIQKEFAGYSLQELFRQFDNLKTLEMLTDISIPVMLEDEVKATTDHFSDGQFQSVYIYSIIEIFKDRNCLTLLDEPDSLLHPEWQFDFLKQVFAIAESDVAKNHVLMSSHSASTITSSKERTLNLFEIKENRVEVSKVSKKEIILALSNGSIKLSEDESIMSINAFLRNNKEPVLFTEGISDECILETAWEKLFPSERRCFCIHSAFDRQFLRNLCIREELRNNNPGRLFFALFDFDDAVDDWKQIGKIDVITDPYHGLVKKHSGYDLFACLLPVPQNETIKQQVFKPGTTLHWDAGKDCHLTIELLFYGLNETTSYYKTTDQSCGGKMIVFSGDKVKFAEEVIPKLPKAAFEIFRPMFEFIKTKCSSASVGPEQSSSGESAAKA